MTSRRLPNGYPMPPDLQELVGRCGGYHLITDEDWAEYDAAVAQWEIDRRIFTCGHTIESRKHTKER